MNDEVKSAIVHVLGRTCCNVFIGTDRSITIGFDEMIPLHSRLGETRHGKWEIGSYYACWRIVKGRQVICGSQDVVDSIDELREAASILDTDRITAIEQQGEFDVNIGFESGISVQLFTTFSDDDYVFYLFMPQNKVVTFSSQLGWILESSIK